MTTEARGERSLPGVTATFTFSGHSDRGVIRRVNEDCYVAAPPVFVVADGMGGHSHGELASRAAAAAFAEAFAEAQPTRPDRVLDVIRQANEDVLALTAGHPDTVAGTTIAGLAFVRVGESDNFHWMVFNVGDSRVYSWDGRKLAQVSVDHSAVQELVDAGLITRLEADAHPERNVVTRALGADPVVDPDVWLMPVGGHQTFLLCSDGLTKELSDDEIARIIVVGASEDPRDHPPLSLSQRLVRAAVAAGGSDNVTAVIVESQVVGTPASTEDTIERPGLSRLLEDTGPRR